MNPKCKYPKIHATKDCWHKGGTSAHKAPVWWKAIQAKKSTAENSVKANTVEAMKEPTEYANVATSWP